MTRAPHSGPSWLPGGWSTRQLPVAAGFSLAETCGPVAWAGGRWPDADWRDGCLVRVVARSGVSVPVVVWPGVLKDTLEMASPAADEAVDLDAILNPSRPGPDWDDPVIAGLSARFPGLRPFAYGSVYLGLLTSIVGQSISIASAATTLGRLAAMLTDPVELSGRRFVPLPEAERLASATIEQVRTSGVTWRRAGALVAIARLAADGQLPSDGDDWEALATADRIMALRELPLVGPWTARSALLWGVADDSVWPSGDVALLRAARLAYGEPGLTPGGLDRLAEGWGDAPGRATRLLWAGLFGVAPATMAS